MITSKGKVMDVYKQNGKCALITTDRLSACDRTIANLPFKGSILSRTSKFWMEQTKHILPNAVISYPCDRVVIMHKCKSIPLEIVVRKHITGMTRTSLWTAYEQGAREYCGHKFPDGLIKNQALPKAIVTPTTKSKEGDIPISPHDIIESKILTKQEWEYIHDAALALFEYGYNIANKKGFVLADTKFEFGKSKNRVLLIDELFTNDTSRYWDKQSFFQDMSNPISYDKSRIIGWYKHNFGFTNIDTKLPAPPQPELDDYLSRLITVNERLTGKIFNPEECKYNPDLTLDMVRLFLSE